MIKKYDVIEILTSALRKYVCKKGQYYNLIKDYILNYEKADTNVKNKIKNLMIFIQDYGLQKGEKTAIKNLKNCLDKLSATKSKRLYLRLYSVCLKYSADTVINMLKELN